MTNKQFAIAFLLVLLLALVVRLGFISLTAWDWDEPVYTAVSNAVNEVGFPSFRTGAEEPVWYSFHPPFHFFVLANWYNLVGQHSIEAGRVLSSLIATATVAAAMLFTLTLTKSRATALLVGFFLAIDGWFSYTSMLVKFDTAAILLGVVGLTLFLLSQKRADLRFAVLAGLFIGLALIYKHVAGIFLLAVVLGFRRKNSDNHLFAVSIALLVGLLYVVFMGLVVGEPFTHASIVQVRRVLGSQEARGLNYGLAEVVQALGTTYWAFGGTLVFLAFGLGATVLRGFQHIMRRKQLERLLLTAWTLAALTMLVLVRLRNPHYLGFLIVPTTIAGAIQLVDWWQRRGWWKLVVVGITVVITLLNLTTFAIRLFQVESGNAFAELQQVMTDLPQAAVVIAEEPICGLIEQTCYRMGVTQSEARIAEADPDFVIVYTSITQRPPTAPDLQRLIARGTEVARVSDWKAVIVIIYVGDVELMSPNTVNLLERPAWISWPFFMAK